MSEKIEIDVHSEAFSLSNEQKEAVMSQMKSEFGKDVKISVNTREEGVFYNITTAMISTVGTVVVNNPQIFSDVIKYIYTSDHLSVNDITGFGDGSLVEVTVDQVNLDVDILNIGVERKVEVDESTTIIVTSSEEDAEKLEGKIAEASDDED